MSKQINADDMQHPIICTSVFLYTSARVRENRYPGSADPVELAPDYKCNVLVVFLKKKISNYTN